MNSDEFLVLRFRDIERSLGETIQSHLRIIANGGTEGATWWGWLYRTFEQVPLGYLQALRDKFQSSDFGVIFLYDTGQSRLYRAHCVDIVATAYPERSPDMRLTPAYYHDRSAPAWFKLTDIQDAPESDLVGRTCVMMPSATDECAIDLLGSTVRNLKELRKQEVTMWVLGGRR